MCAMRDWDMEADGRPFSTMRHILPQTQPFNKFVLALRDDGSPKKKKKIRRRRKQPQRLIEKDAEDEGEGRKPLSDADRVKQEMARLHALLEKLELRATELEPLLAEARLGATAAAHALADARKKQKTALAARKKVEDDTKDIVEQIEGLRFGNGEACAQLAALRSRRKQLEAQVVEIRRKREGGRFQCWGDSFVLPGTVDSDEGEIRAMRSHIRHFEDRLDVLGMGNGTRSTQATRGAKGADAAVQWHRDAKNIGARSSRNIGSSNRVMAR